MKDLINDKNATLVDVRSVGEFSMGSVVGSMNIPMEEVPSRMEEFRNMSKPLILFCATGNRSGQVQRFLQSNGIDNTHNGGGWREVNYMVD